MSAAYLSSVLLVTCLAFAGPPQAEKKPLNQEQVMRLLREEVPSQRLADLVQRHGIDFELTEKYLQLLRDLGAEDVLLTTLRAEGEKFRRARAAPAIPKPPSPALELYLTRARERLKQQDHSGALKEIDAVLNLDPTHASAHELRGDVLVQLGRIDEGKAEYLKYLELVLRGGEQSRVEEKLQALEAKIEAQRKAEEQRAKEAAHEAVAAYLKGEALEKEGQLVQAAAEYGKYLKLAPDAPDRSAVEGKLKRIAVAVAKKEEETRQRAIERARARYESWPPVERALYLFLSNNFTGAVQELRPYLEQNPSDTTARLTLGSALFRLDRHAESRKVREEAYQQDPNNWRARNSRPGAFFDTYEAWDREVGQLARADNMNPTAHIRLGQRLSSRDKEASRREYEAGADLLRRRIEMNSEDLVSRAQLELILVDRDLLADKSGALQQLRELIRLDPANPNWHTQLGLFLLFDKGDESRRELQEAARLYRELIKAEPANMDFYRELASILMYGIDRAGQLEVLREGLRVHPHDAGLLNDLGYALLRGKPPDLPGAIQAFRQAIAQEPDFENYHWGLGNALAKAGDERAAIQALQRAVELEPRSRRSRAELVRMLRVVGDLDGAILQWQQHLKLDPTLPLSLREGYVLLLTEAGRLDAAKKEFREALQVGPIETYHGDTFWRVGKALGKAGDIEGGIAVCEEGLRLFPEDSLIPYCLAELKAASRKGSQ